MKKKDRSLKQIWYKIMETLVDRIVAQKAAQKSNAYENKELYDFLELTTDAIDNFEVLRKEMFTSPYFMHLSTSIDHSYQNANKIDLETSELAYRYKARFVQNLLCAFRTIPFFRFRVLAVEKTRHVLETYKMIRTEHRKLSYLIR